MTRCAGGRKLSDMDNAVTVGIGTKLYGDERTALLMAQGQADINGAPVGVWKRDGWVTVCEDPEPIENGWQMIALVEPWAWYEAGR